MVVDYLEDRSCNNLCLKYFDAIQKFNNDIPQEEFFKNIKKIKLWKKRNTSIYLTNVFIFLNVGVRFL